MLAGASHRRMLRMNAWVHLVAKARNDFRTTSKERVAQLRNFKLKLCTIES